MDSNLANGFLDTSSNWSSLYSVLVSLEADLQNPYAQQGKKVMESVEVQLKCALSEVTQREKDLAASIGILKFFIDKNRALENRVMEVEEHVGGLMQKLIEKDEEVLRGKNEFDKLEERFHEVSDNLERIEEELFLISQDYNQLQKEKSKGRLNLSIDSISLDRFSAEISDITSKFREEHEDILSKFHIEAKIEAELKVAALEEQLQAANQLITQLDFQISRGKLYTRSSEYQSPCKPLRDSFRSPSIKSDFSEYDTSPETFKLSLETDSTYTSSFLTCKNFEISKQEGILILPSSSNLSKTSIDQEFFAMVINIQTLNIVKMNSHYFEHLEVSEKGLYEISVKNKIPMHKWHLWIESQLNAQYLKSTTQQSIQRKKHN